MEVPHNFFVMTALCLAIQTHCLIATAFAAHPMITDDAGTLGKGTVQIELNGDIGEDKSTNTGQTTKYNSSQIASTIGVAVTDKIDLTFGYTHPWGSSDVNGNTFNDNGSNDFSLNMKWQVFEHKGYSFTLKPQIGYSCALGVPENDYTMSYGVNLILTKEFEPFAVHCNVGYTYNDYNLASTRDANRSSIWNFSLAGTYDVIKETLKLAADFGAATNQDKTSNTMLAYGLAGFMYSVYRNIDLSAGVKVGLTAPETDLTGTFGLTLRF